MPVYIRLTGGSNIKQIYNKDYTPEIGEAEVLRDGLDVCFFSAVQFLPMF